MVIPTRPFKHPSCLPLRVTCGSKQSQHVQSLGMTLSCGMFRSFPSPCTHHNHPPTPANASAQDHGTSSATVCAAGLASLIARRYPQTLASRRHANCGQHPVSQTCVPSTQSHQHPNPRRKRRRARRRLLEVLDSSHLHVPRVSQDHRSQYDSLPCGVRECHSSVA
jgi:hypothetical protein